MEEKIKNIQNAYLYKKGLKESLTESEKNLTLLFNEEELKELFYEKTFNIKPEIVIKTVSHIKSAFNKLPKEEYNSVKEKYIKILDGWNIEDLEPINVSSLSQEELRQFYKTLKNLAGQYKIKLPLDENDNILLIDEE